MHKSVSDTEVFVGFKPRPGGDPIFADDLIRIHISRLEDHYIFGPLYTSSNNIICDVATEGGGEGNNVWWNDIFVFQVIDKEYKIIAYANSPKICGCEKGNFYPATIEFGRIVGISNCWSTMDPGCCPSLDYKSIVKLDKDKLVFVSKTKIEGNMK